MAREKDVQSDLFLNTELSENQIPSVQKGRVSELLGELILSVLDAEVEMMRRGEMDNE